MRTILAGLIAVAAMAGSAIAQSSQDQPPPECRYDARRQVEFAACYNASSPGSPWRALAAINLGSEAFLREDYALAVLYYDEARPPAGQQMYSDIVFHTFRGVSYWRVGRRDEAMADADVVYRMLQRDPTLQMRVDQFIPPGLNEEMIYVYMLPIFQAGDAERFETARAVFMAMPAQGWPSYANRAAVLQEIGDLPGALDMSARALAEAPDEPSVLNNHCYILLQAERAGEALPYCERAVRAAPTIAAVRHSVAEVYAALGRCAEAERELGEARRLDPATVEYQQPLTCSAH